MYHTTCGDIGVGNFDVRSIIKHHQRRAINWVFELGFGAIVYLVGFKYEQTESKKLWLHRFITEHLDSDSSDTLCQLIGNLVIVLPTKKSLKG